MLDAHSADVKDEAEQGKDRIESAIRAWQVTSEFLSAERLPENGR
jgi:hypothetical protein